MSVPTQTAVLVIGGGPGGSYSASVLAREGVDVVLLDAEKFPRYHIGESMLASMRFFLRFIDLEDTFDRHGFEKKYGATFKITTKNEAYTNFAASLGQGGFSWNVIRSESDELIFRHAEKSGAKTFDGTKVDSLTFEPYPHNGFNTEARLANPGRPVSANWSRKDGTTGTIKFDYLVDASGRKGIVSTKYLKNRKFNEGLKNIASWTYWKGAKRFKPGAENENSPFFEALTDGSGWVWAIPLHNGTLSVGLAVRQDFYFGRKKASSLEGVEFYKDYLNMAPQIKEMLSEAEVVSDIKQASDWSYSASAYAGPHFRVVGDAGCFVDPYFSSGVHLALTSGLSAAISIQASRRGQADERSAAHWHTTKVSEGYTRFLLLVMTVLRQLRMKETQVITTEEEEGFDMAFKKIQPVIQGVADTRTEDAQVQRGAAESVEFALGSFQVTPEKQRAVIDKIERAQAEPETLEKLSPEEVHILGNIVTRTFEREKDELDLTNFAGDVIDGLSAKLSRGDLGLFKRDPQIGNNSPGALPVANAETLPHKIEQAA
ncbi:Flavin-dependent halogenase [Hyphodiscus hymeniophilus]|uniref:Flavin-dependent halogenase n=1 Tax=Hyphodiscus hymeniophilus TaxID=353542 RepID=A0A9P7AYP8_9HELO|nr:Flavin-dependent halogenase [Hyphodiscus hymeniophilus]